MADDAGTDVASPLATLCVVPGTRDVDLAGAVVEYDAALRVVVWVRLGICNASCPVDVVDVATELGSASAVLVEVVAGEDALALELVEVGEKWLALGTGALRSEATLLAAAFTQTTRTEKA